MKKLIKKSFHRKEEGFTLIELLIVIVIIGILAGVLIAVINPVRQQNRARNATVRASMLKVAFAINSVRAGIGRLPANEELDTELENMTPFAGQCEPGAGATAGDYLNCVFNLSGTTMPKYCAGVGSAEPTDTGSADCSFRVVSVANDTNTDLLSGQFRIAGAKFDLDTSATQRERHLYIFDSRSGLLECGGAYPYQGTDYTDMVVNNGDPIDDTNCHNVAE
ncbi:prepilin-type N-terminal cleavage/methylation domain-containing protein [Patescibacteria group bacterium]|nr:prepilin-type N-terminal cleavage/methylation domain-containing protein [Patescibacteria group bacterium]